MNEGLRIAMSWERLEEGAPEERASFGLLSMRHGSVSLTEGIDGFIDSNREGPLVAGHHLAEWLAWNWWRLVHEPKPQGPSAGWGFAHRMSSIGEGYVWPNVTAFSDGERTVLLAKPTHPAGFAAFRYTTDWRAVLPTQDFVAAVDAFVEQVQGRLRARGVEETDLDRLWAEVLAERADPELAAFRRIEALLGHGPDEAEPHLVERMLADAARLGREAVAELAAALRPGVPAPTADALEQVARSRGSDIAPSEMARLFDRASLPPAGQVPAWMRGYQAASALRMQVGLPYDPLPNRLLAELAGVSPSLLTSEDAADQAFVLREGSGERGKVVLRARWEAGRRFQLARMLGDGISRGSDEMLLPVTRSYTYRQKAQRAFAAELLCPFEALEGLLDGDYSPDAREEAARHFMVSERTVTTMLVNYGRLDRDELVGDV